MEKYHTRAFEIGEKVVVERLTIKQMNELVDALINDVGQEHSDEIAILVGQAMMAAARDVC